ncbi:MAG: T9SS type A sorting domain-containing protein [Chitinophagaceae bacterium]|nr:T9SS type A sorting domain-containing protein [Chitinophagaceae bacterium]
MKAKMKQVVSNLLLGFLLLCSTITYAQLPKPTLIGTAQTYSATGAGTSGIPTVTYTIPNGATNKNRVLVVSYNIERFHNPANSNWFADADGYVYNSGTITFVNPNVAGLGSSTNLAGHSFYYYSSTDSTRLSMMTRARYFSIPDGVTGNFTVTFPGLNTPKSASDEMSVIVATFENVKSGNSLNTGGGNVNFSGTTVTAASATQPVIPLGRTSEDLLYLVTGAMSQQSALTLSSGWTSIQSNVVTNSATATYSSLYPNEPDGISHILGRRYGASGYDPGITLTRPSGSAVQTHFGAAKLSTLYPLASPSVSGTVFRDTDGSTNINGSGTHAGGLYVNAIGADGNLAYSAAVDIDGIFTIPNGHLVETYHYKLELSKNTGTIGDPAPAKELPDYWTTVGESTSLSGNDGTADGTIDLTIGSSDRTGLRFGILANYCINGCNGNTFLNTSNPNTLEYDNIISGFHSTIIKQQDGSYLIFGQNTRPDGVADATNHANLYTPTLVHPDNGFDYTGTPLKMAMGTQGNTGNTGLDQYALLTTDGLYIWGGKATTGLLVHSSVKNTFPFEKITNTHITNANTYGLPPGVNPADVKMFFGTYSALAITTCTGEAWVLGWNGKKNGDGTADNAANYNIWHRVKINATTTLDGVVAMRGTLSAMVALTDSGDMYTWGNETYLGEGSAASSTRLYATKMTLPALPTGVKPKMIGMAKSSNANQYTQSSYYLLTTDGQLFGLGNNSKKQLGLFDNTERREWENIKSTNAFTNLTNIVWISPDEHDGAGHTAVTALTADGKLWGWGSNSNNMLGANPITSVDPRYMFGSLNATDKILAVETGGHIVSIFKDCDYKLGYIGHQVNGSYGTTSIDASPNFRFDGVRFENLCSIELPPYPQVRDLEICAGQTVDLEDALQNTALQTGVTYEYYTGSNASGTLLTNTEVTTAGAYSIIATTAAGCKDTVNFMVRAELCTLLPVTLTSFDAYKKGNTALLKWVTASEQNSKGFEIERSADGRSWTNIGFTNSKSTDGSVKSDYNFTDNNPLYGKNFYRLKQVDFGGKYEYSPVRVVSFDKESNISIYPNPVTDKVTITGLKGGESIKFYDVTGRIVHQSKAVNASVIITLEKVSEGVYYISITGKDGAVSSHKIVKGK